jgi:superfamily II DNA/RNA helicase
MGFIPDIERIFKLTPFTRQTLFFSATMAPEITRITEEFLHNPVRVEVARQATTSETIEQWVCKHAPKRKDTGAAEKREVLRRIIRAEGEALTNGIIFCNRKVDVDVVAKSLKKHGFDAAALHGDLDQSVRTRILTSFRDGALKLLVASDVAARGLDIPNVSHIFNFDVPIHSEDYVHRIGRTGRAGRTGKSVTLCLPFEQKYLDKIEELVKKTIPVMESPLASAEAAEFEARPPREDRRADQRGRRGRGEDRRPRTPREDRPAPAAETATPAAEARTAERPARREEPLREEPRRAEPRGEETRRDDARRHDARRDRRDHRDEDRVPGMGDHVPAFLLREFRIVDSGAEADTDVQDEEVTVAAEAVAETPETVEGPETANTEAAPARAPRRRAPRKRAASPADEATPSAA